MMGSGSDVGVGTAHKKRLRPLIMQGRSLNFAVPPCFSAEYTAPLPALYRERPADFITAVRWVFRVLGRPERFLAKRTPFSRGRALWGIASDRILRQCTGIIITG